MGHRSNQATHPRRSCRWTSTRPARRSPALERESLERRLEEPLLETLIGHAVFPRYAFPTDVVTFWVSKPRQPGDAPGKRTFDYEPQRDLQLALTEYAPGRSLTIDKWRFESAALYSPYEPTPAHTIQRQRPYTSCSDCSWATMETAMAQVTLCPVCGSDQLTRAAFITPAGFAPDINAKREVDRGQAISYAGMTDRATARTAGPAVGVDARGCDGRLLRWTGPRRLVMVNKGVGQRGFRVCPDCGRAEPEYGPGFTATKLMKGGAPTTHQHPLEKGHRVHGVADGPFYLGHEFPDRCSAPASSRRAPVQLGAATTTGFPDARLAHGAVFAGRSARTRSVARPADRRGRALWLVDAGDGRTRRRGAALPLRSLAGWCGLRARRRKRSAARCSMRPRRSSAACDCPSSCYRCIRHYGNNWIHASLDRHLALALLRHLRTGELPSLDRPGQGPRTRGAPAVPCAARDRV